MHYNARVINKTVNLNVNKKKMMWILLINFDDVNFLLSSAAIDFSI